MARAYGSRAQMALAFESTYGTAPASGFFKVPFASTSLGQDQGLIDNELLGYGRDPLAPSRDVINADGDMVIPVDANAIGHWLKALLGAPVTTGTTPKVHTFVSGGLTLPSLSIEKGLPEVPRFEMFSGVRVDRMAFNQERGKGKNLQCTASLIAQGMTPNTATQAGTPTDIAVSRFSHFQGSIKRDGVSLGNIISTSMTYSNNLDRVETIRADGKIEAADPTIAACSGNIVARLADTTLLDQATNGTACSLEFAWTASASLSLVLTVHSVFLPQPRIEIPGPKGIEVTFDWQGALAASPARMLTAVLTNAVASY